MTAPLRFRGLPVDIERATPRVIGQGIECRRVVVRKASGPFAGAPVDAFEEWRRGVDPWAAWTVDTCSPDIHELRHAVTAAGGAS